MSRALACAAVLALCARRAGGRCAPAGGRARAGSLARRHPARRDAGAGARRARQLRTACAAAAPGRRGTSRTAVRPARARGRAHGADASSAVYTLWQPPGWHAPRGPAARRAAGPGPRARRTGSSRSRARATRRSSRDSATARTVYYVVDAKLWGFGLLARERESVPVIELDDVRAAAERLRGVANRTPVLTSRTLDGVVGAARAREGGVLPARRRVQVPRRVQQDRLAPATTSRAHGVLAYSSGNHAQAVAIAARLLGTTRDHRHARGRAAGEARRDARLRRRDRHLRPLDREPRGDRRAPRRGARRSRSCGRTTTRS